MGGFFKIQPQQGLRRLKRVKMEKIDRKLYIIIIIKL